MWPNFSLNATLRSPAHRKWFITMHIFNLPVRHYTTNSIALKIVDLLSHPCKPLLQGCCINIYCYIHIIPKIEYIALAKIQLLALTEKLHQASAILHLDQRT